jgi:eukaryotic-like serine/threonine-protein kinase
VEIIPHYVSTRGALGADMGAAMAIEDIVRTCQCVQELERGGQKVVYSAEHPVHGSVVLKIGSYPHPRALERISREVGLLASIFSPYYPKHYGFIVEAVNRSFLIIEERIEGQPLSVCMNRFVSESEIINLIKLLIEALDILWSRRVVHRDIKPQNIIIRPDNRPVVIDLGIARLLDLSSLTMTGMAVGPCTVQNASPEQLRNRKSIIDIRTDFFALGLLTLHLYLGFHPFDPARVGRGESIPDNIINARFVSPETKPDTSAEFVGLVRRLLHTEPHQRFRTKDALVAYIEEQWG